MWYLINALVAALILNTKESYIWTWKQGKAFFLNGDMESNTLFDTSIYQWEERVNIVSDSPGPELT
jgi:hypothetical protein